MSIVQIFHSGDTVIAEASKMNVPYYRLAFRSIMSAPPNKRGKGVMTSAIKSQIMVDRQDISDRRVPNHAFEGHDYSGKNT